MKTKFILNKESIGELYKPHNYNYYEPEDGWVMRTEVISNPYTELGDYTIVVTGVYKNKDFLLVRGHDSKDINLLTTILICYDKRDDTDPTLIRSEVNKLSKKFLLFMKINKPFMISGENVLTNESEVKKSSLREQLNLAYTIALEAHSGQFDKQGKPYINHVLKVSNRCKSMRGKIVGFLHDVIEDCSEKGFTAEYLIERGIDPDLVRVVKLVTKTPGQSYEDYKSAVKSDTLAIEVKLSDLKHNMDLTRNKVGLTEKEITRTIRYHKFYVELYHTLDDIEIES